MNRSKIVSKLFEKWLFLLRHKHEDKEISFWNWKNEPQKVQQFIQVCNLCGRVKIKKFNNVGEKRFLGYWFREDDF